MNDEEIRIAIAEACGANPFREEEYPHRTMWTFGEIGSGEPCYTIYDLPDYPNDLNAMHESLSSQGEEFNSAFAKRLWIVATQTKREIHQLTAKDWAECFIWVLQSKRQGGN